MARRKKRILEDEQKRRTVAGVLSIGCSLQAAARMVGCSPSTIRREARIDPEFAAQFEKAKGESEYSYLSRIQKAAKKDQYWRAAAWVLERRHPEHYAARSPDVITFAELVEVLNKVAEIVEAEIPVAKYRKRIRQRLNELSTTTQRRVVRKRRGQRKEEKTDEAK